MSKFSKKFMGRSPFAKSTASAFKSHTPEHGVTREQRGATNEEVRQSKEDERLSNASKEFDTNVAINKDATEKASDGEHGMYSVAKARDMMEKDYSSLSQAEINKLSRSLENLPSKFRKQLQGYLEAGKNPEGETKEAPVDAFTRNYFKEKGIENPTEADYRVASRMYQRSK